ncbi:MAG: hypothetical protein UIH99_04545 [Alphaproteobacteria bacterium]|nr:hypothetical protein [Alphaproteobacteria bacterium]
MNKPEFLDDARMFHLFGRSWVGITYFNLDTQRWSGPAVSADAEFISGYATMLRDSLTSESLFRGNELVAVASMRIQHNLPAHKNVIVNPEYAENGNANVCTIVCRDIETGKIRADVPQWIMVSKKPDNIFEKFDPLELFTRDMLFGDTPARGMFMYLYDKSKIR